LILSSTATHSINPLTRRLGTAAYVNAIALTIVVAAGSQWGHLVSDYAIRWSLAIACFLNLLMLGGKFLQGAATRYREFESISGRRAELVSAQARLQQFAFLTGDVQDWRDANDAIKESQALAESTESLIRQGKTQEASNQILRAETNISYFENLIQTRLSVTLTETLRTKLAQAKSDLNELVSQARQSVLDEDPFTALWNEHERLSEIAEGLSIENEKFSEKIAEFESFFRKITQIRTALRFRQNVASKLDDLARELDGMLPEIELANRLELQHQEIQETYSRVYADINLIRSRTLSNIEEFVSAYQKIQGARAHLGCLLAAVRDTVQVNWTSEDAVGEAMTVRVPRFVGTTSASKAVIMMQQSNRQVRPAKLVMRGALVRVPPELALPENSAAKVASRAFAITGEGGGRGRLDIDICSSDGDILEEHSFQIRVLRSFQEMVRNAAGVGAAGGAVVALMLWYFLDYDPKIATPVGGLIALAVGVMQFLWTHMQTRSFAARLQT